MSARPPPFGTCSPSATTRGLGATPYFGSMPPTFCEPQFATAAVIAMTARRRSVRPAAERYREVPAYMMAAAFEAAFPNCMQSPPCCWYAAPAGEAIADLRQTARCRLHHSPVLLIDP